MKLSSILSHNRRIALATILGLVAGYFSLPSIVACAELISQLFINLLKLVSLPIIFLSIVATASGMESLHEIKSIGKRVIKYTLFTTITAATMALGLFLLLDPVDKHGTISSETLAPHVQPSGNYVDYLIKAIPSNVIQPFNENHVIGVLFLAILLSVAILALPKENRSTLHAFFSSLYSAVMKITSWIVLLMPFAIWAFITLFFKDLRQGLEVKSLALYLVCVLLANVLQAAVILPLILKWKQISPLQMVKGMMPALSVAFFTKSSSAALPMAMRCAQENLKISPKVASFSLPLCTTINMNACAAFILITVLFVSMSNGVVFSAGELFLWIFIATIAAIGNAGVPMGCYFLASAFLATMNVPLNLLGIILPFYTMIDMLESAINVWSDACVTAAVNKEVMQDIQSGVKVPEPETLNINTTRCC